MYEFGRTAIQLHLEITIPNLNISSSFTFISSSVNVVMELSEGGSEAKYGGRVGGQ